MNFDQKFFDLLKSNPKDALVQLGVANPTEDMLKDVKNFLDNGMFAGESLINKLNAQNINVGD